MDDSLLLVELHDQLKNACEFYVNDLEALSDEALNSSPGGTARVPFDFTYEVVVVNHRVATRLTGVTPEPWPFEGWAVAPDDFRSKAKAVADLKASVEAVKEAAGANVGRMVPTTEGEKSAYSLAAFAAMHMMYHDAQLNYIQSLGGDGEMHWM